MSSYLKVNRLILVGVRKIYITKFGSGVNIIYGDSDTGKSSILEFINYLLGASNIELADEVNTSVKYAALEIDINNETYTVKRDIYKTKELIEVYPCKFENCTDHYPKKYFPTYNNTKSSTGFYPDFLLDALNYPKVKIKEAPTQVNSNLKRLGFRGIFKYCYLNQDDVGSKGFLDLGNWVKAVSNKEVFKYIFRVLDSSITELESDISEKSKDSAVIKQKFDAVSEFLRDTRCETLENIDYSIENLDTTLDMLRNELKEINKSMTSSSANYNEFKSIFNELQLKKKSADSQISKCQDLLDKYIRLNNDYDNDIKKLESSISSKKKIGEICVQSSPCPICDSEIAFSPKESTYEVSSYSSLENELTSVKKRKRDIKGLVDTYSVKYKSVVKERALYQTDLVKARQMLDTESSEMITPYLTQRDTLIKEIASHEKMRESYVNSLKIRNQQSQMLKSFEKLNEDISLLQEQLGNMKQNAPDLTGILDNLGDRLNSYLSFVNIKNRHGIGINPSTFAPVVRDKDYQKLTSGGLRTITSIGYMLALLETAIKTDIYHPKLLMIDTVGKYLGKTTKSKYISETNTAEDGKEGIGDPQKYKNLYDNILNLANSAKKNRKRCQIILVDNDVPDSFVERYKDYIVAHYSSIGENGLKYGLIDDYLPE